MSSTPEPRTSDREANIPAAVEAPKSPSTENSPRTPTAPDRDELFRLFGFMSVGDEPCSPLDIVLKRNLDIRESLQTNLQPSVAARKSQRKSKRARDEERRHSDTRLSVKRPK